MARCTRFRVVGRFLMASRPQEATVTIDRVNGLVMVRPLRSRRQFMLPLATVAEIVVQRLLSEEVRAKQRKRRKVT